VPTPTKRKIKTADKEGPMQNAAVSTDRNSTNMRTRVDSRLCTVRGQNNSLTYMFGSVCAQPGQVGLNSVQMHSVSPGLFSIGRVGGTLCPLGNFYMNVSFVCVRLCRFSLLYIQSRDSIAGQVRRQRSRADTQISRVS